MSLFLTWSTFQMGYVVGCGSGDFFDCSHVLQSKWSKWLGVPVSVPGAGLYATLLIALCFIGGRLSRWQRSAWSICTTCVFAAAAAAVWFVFLQVIVLKHLCPYCLAVHGMGLILMALVVWQIPLSKEIRRWAGLGAASILPLIAGQLLVAPPPTYSVERHDIADEARANLAVEEFAIEETGEPDVEEFGIEEIDVEGVDVGPESSQTEETESSAKPTAEEHPNEVARAAEAWERLRERMLEVYKDFIPAASQPENLKPVGVTIEEPAGPTASLTPVPQEQEGGTKTNLRQPKKQAIAKPKGRSLTFTGARAKLNVAQWPIIGSPEAPYVVVKLFDYTCPYCRQMHQQLKDVRSRFDNQLAVVMLPVPLNSNCNSTVTRTHPNHADACELARLALAVWKLAPELFTEYNNWLFEVERRTATEARIRAEQLVDRAALQKMLAGPLVGQFLAQHVRIYQRAGRGTLPKVLTERVTLSGRMSSPDALYNLLRDELVMQGQTNVR